MPKQLTLPGLIVKKNNELIRTRINIENVDSSRVLANLIACIKFDETDFKNIYRIAIKDFISDTGGKAYTQIKKACRELSRATAEIEEPDPDSPFPYLRLYTFFSSISCRNGIIEARFNWEMSPFLLELKKCFTQYNLLDYLSLPSVYSQRIFEILKSWEKIEQGYVDIELSELHRLLNSPNSQKKDFKEFRRYVLEKAYKDINEKTDLSFDWEPIKNGRAVESIRFLFNGKQAAIAEKGKQDKKAERKRQLDTQRFIKAVNCAKEKKGICHNQDNIRIICRMCLEKRLCDEMKKKY